MIKRRVIKKIVVLGAWFLVISGMATLLIASNSRKKDHLCREVLIGIKGSGEKYYIEKSDVVKLLEANANGPLLNREVSSVDLSKLERSLENNSWIRTAELYFDSKDALHVFVEEREPVARIFTVDGSSFYMDSSGHRMPLLEKLSARVPVVTGFTNAKKFTCADSVLLDEVKIVAAFIYSNSFWNAQVGQIDITPEGKFELVPVIGDHIIKIGTGEKIKDQLECLYVFYKQVMSKVGFSKYAELDLRYDGQVIGVKKGPVSEVDSIQLQKNIEELVNRVGLQTIDDEMLPQESEPAVPKDSVVSNTPAQSNSVSTKTNPNPSMLNEMNENSAKANESNPPEKTKPVQKKN